MSTPSPGSSFIKLTSNNKLSGTVARGVLEANTPVERQWNAPSFIYKTTDGGTVTLSYDTSVVELINGGLTYPSVFPLGCSMVIQAIGGGSISYLFKNIANSAFVNEQVVDIDGTYNLPPLTYAIVVEGDPWLTSNTNFTVQEGDWLQGSPTNDTPVAVGTSFLANTNSNVYGVVPSQDSITFTGQGKIVTFTIFNA